MLCARPHCMCSQYHPPQKQINVLTVSFWRFYHFHHHWLPSIQFHSLCRSAHSFPPVNWISWISENFKRKTLLAMNNIQWQLQWHRNKICDLPNPCSLNIIVPCASFHCSELDYPNREIPNKTTTTWTK